MSDAPPTWGADLVPACWVLCSGGKDSMATAAYMAQRDRLRGVIALDTGISTPDWRDFIETETKRQGWALRVFKTPVLYEWFVLKFGFPGPGQGHQYAMTFLKGRALRLVKKALGKVPLASGVRLAESARRALTTKPVGRLEGHTVYAPLYDWTTDAVWAYFHAKGLQRAPGYSTLGISGDCLCGAFARPGEREDLQVCYPAVAERLGALERDGKVKGMGLKGSWGWGINRPPRKKKGSEALICVECGDTEPRAI